ncbi:MAG TPA: hypothetical protein VIM70_20515 [Clostridium sp.]|uniref:hypothetical protein n=1 Tax=Clostridium sp. TaxID=1506 RepID=UPI002F932FD0
MVECSFLTTMDEEIDCFKECALHKWTSNGGKCPFAELENFKAITFKEISDYDSFNESKLSSLRILYE